MVLPNPLTFALIRVVCFEASISYTSFAAIPFARASDKIGAVILGLSSTFGVLNIGMITTGTIITPSIANTIVTIAPQICQVRGNFRTTPTSAITTNPPRIIRSTIPWSDPKSTAQTSASPARTSIRGNILRKRSEEIPART